jgi:hypothetical protein
VITESEQASVVKLMAILNRAGSMEYTAEINWQACVSFSRAIGAMLAKYYELQWQPMETAPRNGDEVLLAVEQRAGMPGKMLVGHWMPGGYCIDDHPPINAGWYFWNGQMFDRASKPIAWMPLPSPPTQKSN